MGIKPILLNETGLKMVDALNKIANKNNSGNNYNFELAQTLSGNEEDKAPSVKAVAKALEKVGQLKPEFANSIEECVDTTKLYVLPDGYLYAYMYLDETREVVEKITDGFLDNFRLSTGFGEVQSLDGMVTTPYIDVSTERFPLGKEFKVRLTGATWVYNTINTNVSGYAHSLYNDESFVYAHYTNNRNADAYPTKNYKLNIISQTEVEFLPYDINAEREYNQVRFSGSGTSETAVVEVIYTEVYDGYVWANTGLAFVPADYEDRIIDLEESTEGHESRLKLLEMNEMGGGVPEYWFEELEAKAEAIQQAMERAGRNKSAFLWYTDAHWPNNSKTSPTLLKYLQKNTPINKVNFGGDIVGGPPQFTHDNVKYVYEWRKLLAGISNHHGVYGNHDVNHRITDVSKIAYSLLLASEETPDMVIGGDSYYYIDCPAEKTRYLYLSFFTNNTTDQIAQGQFIIDAISGVNDGWHIVAIAHRWWNYKAVETPMVGSVPKYESEILQVFDKYNARGIHAASTYFNEQDFENAKGKVEFCIGGHVHVDYDFTSVGGIPVIITAADTNQERASEETEDSGTLGTTTESAVFGIIADYDNSKITVVGVGRGTSREIVY